MEDGTEKAVKPAKVAPTPRKIEEDKGGGQINVTLGSDEKDRFVQLRINGKTVDSQQSIDGVVQLRFPTGWPAGDFSYTVV